MKTLVLALAIMLSGCATFIDQHKEPPADWPLLKVTEHRLDMWPLIKQCYPSVSLMMKLLGGFANACAWINLQEMTCDIYVHTAATESDPTLIHEREHCQGRDHFGDSTLADLWANWKARMTAGGATYVFIRHDGVPHAHRQ